MPLDIAVFGTSSKVMLIIDLPSGILTILLENASRYLVFNSLSAGLMVMIFDLYYEVVSILSAMDYSEYMVMLFNGKNNSLYVFLGPGRSSIMEFESVSEMPLSI